MELSVSLGQEEKLSGGLGGNAALGVAGRAGGEHRATRHRAAEDAPIGPVWLGLGSDLLRRAFRWCLQGRRPWCTRGPHGNTPTGPSARPSTRPSTGRAPGGTLHPCTAGRRWQRTRRLGQETPGATWGCGLDLEPALSLDPQQRLLKVQGNKASAGRHPPPGRAPSGLRPGHSQELTAPTAAHTGRPAPRQAGERHVDNVAVSSAHED